MQHYSQYPDLINLDTTILTTSITFINKIISWIDYTRNFLVSEGNTASNIWVLITQVIQDFFKERIYPHISNTTGDNFIDQTEQTRVMFWGLFRTHIDTSKLLEEQLKDNTIMTGAYAKWLVNYSGRKYVLDTQVAVKKLVKEVETLKGDMISQSDLRAVRALAGDAKGIVDKALATKE